MKKRETKWIIFNRVAYDKPGPIQRWTGSEWSTDIGKAKVYSYEDRIKTELPADGYWSETATDVCSLLLTVW